MSKYLISFTNNGHTEKHFFSTFEVAAFYFWVAFSTNHYDSGNVIDSETGEVYAYFYANVPGVETDYKLFRSSEFVDVIRSYQIEAY